MKIFKCQMVYICANMNRFSSYCPGGTPDPPPNTYQLRLSVYCFLILRWNSRKTTALTKQSDARTTTPPPPLPIGKKNLDPLLCCCIRTQSILFLSGITKPLLINWTAQSFPVYYLLLVQHSSERYCCTARKGPWPPSPPYFPELGASLPGKRISGIATNFDPVGKPKTTKSIY